jgi:hypothetical protein
MADHQISRAANLYAGDVYYERYNTHARKESGLIAHLPIWLDLGAPAAIRTTAYIAAATGAELPNIATITYTTANAAVSPVDDAQLPATALVVMADQITYSVWAQDVPRNVSLNVTHASSIVALSCLISGFDEYGEAMTETLAVTATGTTKTTAGKKAFKWIKSIAFTSAGNATADTANLGWADVLGLSFRFDRKDRVIPLGDGLVDASATIVVADDTNPATTSTGDIRGTIDFNTASDGTKKFSAWMMPVSRSDRTNAFGQVQA